MTVKFITGYSSYRAGDRAGFSPEKEKELVGAGVAKEVQKPNVDKMVRGTETKEKTYKCKCGREFDTPQGKAAHSRFCEEAGE